MRKQETVYYLETADGQVMRVPQSKLKDFLKLTEKEQQKKSKQKDKPRKK